MRTGIDLVQSILDVLDHEETRFRDTLQQLFGYSKQKLVDIFDMPRVQRAQTLATQLTDRFQSYTATSESSAREYLYYMYYLEAHWLFQCDGDSLPHTKLYWYLWFVRSRVRFNLVPHDDMDVGDFLAHGCYSTYIGILGQAITQCDVCEPRSAVEYVCDIVNADPCTSLMQLAANMYRAKHNRVAILSELTKICFRMLPHSLASDLVKTYPMLKRIFQQK
jgi:hypothetical protein